MPLREIAKVGTWGQDGTTITEEDLKEVVETFIDEAPISLGHSTADYMPKLGSVKNPFYDPETKTLRAEVIPNSLLADAEQKGIWDKVSIGIRKRAEDGKKYIHHLAYLGSVPPKIKGLKILEGLNFINAADVDEYWTFNFADDGEEKKPKPPSMDSLEISNSSWDVNEAAKRVFDKYGIEGLREYSLYKDPEADPENKTAYKFLVVDIIGGEPKIVARAVSASKAIIEGGRGGTSEDIVKEVRPKVERLDVKVNKDKTKENGKKEAADAEEESAMQNNSNDKSHYCAHLNMLLKKKSNGDDDAKAELIKKMAEEAGLTPHGVRAHLRSEVKKPSLDVIEAFANVLDGDSDHIRMMSEQDGNEYEDEQEDMNGKEKSEDEENENQEEMAMSDAEKKELERLKAEEGQRKREHELITASIKKNDEARLRKALAGKIPVKDKFAMQVFMDTLNGMPLTDMMELADADGKKITRSKRDAFIEACERIEAVTVPPGEIEFGDVTQNAREDARKAVNKFFGISR